MATIRDAITENKIDIVTTTENNVTVTQPSIQTVEVLTGPIGPAGQSSIIDTGSFATTGSNTFIGNQTISGSVNISSSLVASGLNYPTVDGDNGDILVTDGDGNLTFDRTRIYAQVKNISGTTLQKGTPVHVSSSVGNLDEVIAASASVASTMPATFILAQDLNDDEEGLGILTGFINGVNTSAFGEGDVVYVGANGGYTNIKPTGSNLVQNLGIVTKVAVNGSGFIYGIGRANDVPNITPGYAWVGNSDSVATPTPTSSFAQYSNSTTATYTSANILALDEVSILPALSSNQYYEYKLIIEYNFGTTPYSISGFGGGIILISSLGNTISSLSAIPTTSADEIVGFAQGVTELGSALKITLRGGSTITNGDGDLSIKIQYNIATFG